VPQPSSLPKSFVLERAPENGGRTGVRGCGVGGPRRCRFAKQTVKIIA